MCRSALDGCTQSSLWLVDVVIVSFSCPGGEIRGCPLGLSSDPRRGALIDPIAIGGPAGPPGLGSSFPLTAVNLEVGESGGAVGFTSSGGMLDATKASLPCCMVPKSLFCINILFARVAKPGRLRGVPDSSARSSTFREKGSFIGRESARLE